jgi:RNase P/RNase MRP subunit POP5
MKLKTLPSLKERKRYIAFKVISQEPINYSNLEAAIWNTALEFLGEEGVSKTSMWLG